MSYLQNQFQRWLAPSRSERKVRRIEDCLLVLGSDAGLKREENQDRTAAALHWRGPAPQDWTLFIGLADGMGGMERGAECATLALAAFFDAVIAYPTASPTDALLSAANFANHEVFKFAKGRGGATLTALSINGKGNLAGINVGDSRIYAYLNSAEPKLKRLTTDDNMAEAYGGHGHELIQFVGVGNGLKPHSISIPQGADFILLTTDGVHFLSEHLMIDICKHAPDHFAAAERLLALSRWYGGPDNATIAAILPDYSRFRIDIAIGEHIRVWNPYDELFIAWRPTQPPAATGATEIGPNDPKPEKDTSRVRRPSKKHKRQAPKQQQLTIDISPVTPDDDC
jgi:PPM family protein phosphatase